MFFFANEIINAMLPLLFVPCGLFSVSIPDQIFVTHDELLDNILIKVTFLVEFMSVNN